MITDQISQQKKKIGLSWARVWPEAAVLGFYLALSFAFTWPLLLNWNKAIPGDGRDGWQMVWNLWWVRYAVEHGQNPFQTDLQFYPQGTGLYLHALNALNGFLSLPMQYLAGSVAGYNFIVIFSLTFSAYGAFCLARYLWGSWPGALIAGIGFGFSSYHFAHLLGHLNLISAEFIPFYLLFLFKALNSPQKWRKPALLAVLTLVCGTLLELQYTLYLAIASIFYLVYITLLSSYEKWRKKITTKPKLLVYYVRALFIAGLYLLLTLPLTIPMFNEALSNPNTVPLREDLIYSADLLAYLYPSPFQPLWGGAMREAIRPWTATLIEKIVFPGYTLYGLALLGLGLYLWQNRKRLGKFSPNPETSKIDPKEEWKPGASFWLGLALVFVVLSFGRKLHINGLEIGPTLPAALIYKLPILNITRVPSRYAVIAILSFGMLAAWGFSKLKKSEKSFRSQVSSIKFQSSTTDNKEIFTAEEESIKYKLSSNNSEIGSIKSESLPDNSNSIVNRQSSIVNPINLQLATRNFVLPLLLSLLLIFELWPAPYPLANYSVPEFYKKLGLDTDKYAILDVPMNVGRDYQYVTDYLEAQMEHHKPLLGGYISRNPIYPPFYGVPVFWQFANFETGPRPDIVPAPIDNLAILRYFNVKYVIVHKDLVRGKRQETALGWAFKLFPQGPVYDAENLVVFEVPQKGLTEPLFFTNVVQTSFYEAEKGPDGRYSRWAQGSQPSLDFWSDRTRTLEISFPIWSFREPHSVDFVFNGKSLQQANVGEETQNISLKLELKPGRNQLNLQIGGKANRPADFAPGNDTRALTINVGELKLVLLD